MQAGYFVKQLERLSKKQPPLRFLNTCLSPLSSSATSKTSYRTACSYEDAYLNDKRTGKMWYLGDFYGSPSCALIGDDESWCLVGGDKLIVWATKGVSVVEGVHWIHAMKITGPITVKLLTDPWGEDPAVWEFDTKSQIARKLCDFTAYRDKPDTGRVIW